MKRIIISLSALAILASCEKEPKENTPPVDTSSENVLILNEGNFQAGNAELGVYNLKSNEYSPNVFATINSKPLGDILYSANKINDELYLVVNNSSKIEVIDPETFESKATITGFTSPRHIISTTAGMAYVSDLFADSIYVIDVSSKTIDHKIYSGGWSEEMFYTDGNVFITHPSSDKIQIIDAVTEEDTSITLSYGPTAIEEDKNGNLWILCGGDPANNINGSLAVINPQNLEILKQIDLGPGSYTNRLVFNKTRDSLYFLTGNVYKISINATSAPTQIFIDGSNYSLYGMGYHSATNELWLSDAKDFNQKGDILIFSANGEFKNSFSAGINPNGFWMEE